MQEVKTNKEKSRLIFASDGFAVMNVFNLLDAGYIRAGGILTAENNNKVSLYISETDLTHYGKIGHEIFSSKEKTNQLISDINELIKNISLLDGVHTTKAQSYSNDELASSLIETSSLSIKFISLYGLLEPHYTFHTEKVINDYISLNEEGLKGRTIFDVIFKERELIKDQTIRNICENVATLAEFKLSTKQAMENLFHGHSTLVRESKKRFGLSDEEDIRLLSIKEIKDFLVSGFEREIFNQKVKDRKDWFVIKSDSDGNLSIFTGLEAKKEIEDVKHKSGLGKKEQTVKELKGQTASTGTYTGRAVVIPYIRSTDSEEYKEAFKEFKQGDVLVTKNSVPEIIEIIKKAGAIVTEEGGITCHGAIMSREFKVPGIVGVDGVVEHIKTGDIVEIDARGIKGKIRILD